MSLLSVEAALAQVIACAKAPVEEELVPIWIAPGRTLARGLAALRTQPPFAASAMDGYALRADDLPAGGTARVIGTSAAGHAFPGKVGAGEAVRIFTGAPLPEGADAVVIQENVERLDAGLIRLSEAPRRHRHIRDVGIDFFAGDTLVRAGQRVDPPTAALIAAMGHGQVPVRRLPRVAILASGDELVRPGEPAGPAQIVASNTYAVAAIASKAGGVPVDLGIVHDDLGALTDAIGRAEAARADVLVTLGGASVGDHDLVHAALTGYGMQPSFWKVAMRPGKPLMHGRIGTMNVLGLPGNPVSAIICAVLFLGPLIRALLGDPQAGAHHTVKARLAVPMKANDVRQDYVRATLAPGEDLPLARPLPVQDSSLLSVLARADGLIVRPPFAPEADAGDICTVLPLA